MTRDKLLSYGARIALLFCFAVACPHADCNEADTLASEQQPIRVLAQYSKGRLVYSIDSTSVAAPDLLRRLGDLLRDSAAQRPIDALIDERLSFKTLANLKGMIDKAGAAHVRYFVCGADKRLMQEVHLSPAVPYPSARVPRSSRFGEKWAGGPS